MTCWDHDWSSDFPQLTENDYGMEWPRGTSQITKELAGFAFNGKRRGFLSRYEHGLNLIRLLWPNQVKLFVRWRHYETREEVIIWNHWFLLDFKRLCNGKRTAMTGCSSSGKTFSVACYSMLMFMCNPSGTTIMVSTTSGSDAERRVWGEIRDLHREISTAKPPSKEPIYPLGTLIDYLKVITFDPGKELEGRRDVVGRDIRNGIILIPIPKGQEGENAIGKIIGTKNDVVIWIIDELPNMIDSILRPESNLESNIKFQLIGIGNANLPSDPHGRMCEPVNGWGSVTKNDEEWEGLFGTQVINSNGRHSPNFHPAVDQSEEDKTRYPFPFLATPSYIRKTALINGRGSAALGEKTIDFCRFAEGFWYGDDVSTTILSAEMVKLHKANEPFITWGPHDKKTIAGFDCGFTSGGDSNELMFSVLGKNTDAKYSLMVEHEPVRIMGTAGDREEYRKSVAVQVVEACKKRGVTPDCFGMDINADGGLMLQAIQQEWESHDIIGLSSLEPADDPKYFHRVTQYWYEAALAVTTGLLRGFNINSRYAKDLFARQYESVGRGKVKVEKKATMKARIGRSPDAGDSFTYNINVAVRHGFELAQPEFAGTQSTERPDIPDGMEGYYGLEGEDKPSEFFGSAFAGDDSEFETVSSNAW